MCRGCKPHFNAKKKKQPQSFSTELTRTTGDQSSRIQAPQQRTSAGMKGLIFTIFPPRHPSWHPDPPLLLYVASLISEVIKHKNSKKVAQKLISCTSRSGKIMIPPSYGAFNVREPCSFLCFMNLFIVFFFCPLTTNLC